MSTSSIPTRRPTARTARGLQDENALKIAPRATRTGSAALGLKDSGAGPVKAGAESKPALGLRARSANVDNTSTAATKRKRLALDDTTNNKNKQPTAGADLKKPAVTRVTARTTTTVTTTSTTTTRPPVASRTTSTATAKQDAEAMAVDSPAKAQAVVRPVVVAAPTGGAGVLRRTASKKQIVVQLDTAVPSTSSYPVLRDDTNTRKEVDEEEERAAKRRRTSSPPDDLARRDLGLHVSSDADNFAAPVEFNDEPQGELILAAPDAGWEDLDAEDVNDPLMVSEYVVEIFDYLKRIEPTTMPNEHYMQEQQHINWAMRSTLVDWIISVHMHFRFLPETLFLCVNVLDRFLSKRLANMDKLQLVGAASLLIAAKAEEMYTPSIDQIVAISDRAFSDTELLKAEKYILKTIEWNMSFPNPINFLRRVSKADEYNVHVRTLAKFFCEIGIVDYKLMGVKPSMLAAASMWLGRLVMESGPWSANLVHYSSYTESEIIPVANLMVNYLLRTSIKHEHFTKKYASKKFMRASKVTREWFAQRFAVNTTVDLARHVDRLREMSTAQEADA